MRAYHEFTVVQSPWSATLGSFEDFIVRMDELYILVASAGCIANKEGSCGSHLPCYTFFTLSGQLLLKLYDALL